MTEAILKICRETNIKVTNILNEISKKEDVTEFITTIQLVQITINSLLKNRKEFKFDLLKDLQNSLKDYENLLVQLNDGSGKLLRMFTNSRLRKKIETENLKIHKKLEQLKNSITENCANKSSPNNKIMTKEEIKPIERQLTEEELEEKMRLSDLIKDQDGKDLWAGLFGLESFMISWDKFISELKKIIPDIKEDEEKVLLYILDNSNTGMINQHKFSEFLKGFGPVKDIVKNIKNILSARWCYGFLTRNETDLLLRNQPPGTFLIRFSSSQPGKIFIYPFYLKKGSFALAFSVEDQEKGVTTAFHILIKSCKPVGFQVHEANDNIIRTFQNLYDIIDFYNLILRNPYSSSLPFESWFEGDFSSSEANEVLAGQKPGTFLIRFSSRVGSYAMSYVDSEGKIGHSLIEHSSDPESFKIINDGEVLSFNTLQDLVSYCSELLKYPYRFTVNELSIEASKCILTWKKERENQLEEIEKIVDDLFDVNKPMTIYDRSGLHRLDPIIDEIINKLFTVNIE